MSLYILYELFDSFNYKRQDYTNVVKGLSYIEKNEIEKDKSIKFTYYLDDKDKASKKEFILDLSAIDIDKDNNVEDYYTIITEKEVKIIMNYGKAGLDNEKQINNLSLLRYFIFLISTINHDYGVYVDAKGDIYKDFVGFMSHKYLRDSVGISENTLISYNKILEDNKIIYINRLEKNQHHEDGSISSLPNHYGRYKDKKYIDQFAEQYLTEKGLGTSDKPKKRNQQLGAIYSWMRKDKKYDDFNLVKEVYNYIHKCNVELQKEIDSKRNQLVMTNSDLVYVENLESRLRDESVFEMYDLNTNIIENEDEEFEELIS